MSRGAATARAARRPVPRLGPAREPPARAVDVDSHAQRPPGAGRGSRPGEREREVGAHAYRPIGGGRGEAQGHAAAQAAAVLAQPARVGLEGLLQRADDEPGDRLRGGGRADLPAHAMDGHRRRDRGGGCRRREVGERVRGAEQAAPRRKECAAEHDRRVLGARRVGLGQERVEEAQRVARRGRVEEVERQGVVRRAHGDEVRDAGARGGHAHGGVPAPPAPTTATGPRAARATTASTTRARRAAWRSSPSSPGAATASARRGRRTAHGPGAVAGPATSKASRGRPGAVRSRVRSGATPGQDAGPNGPRATTTAAAAGTPSAARSTRPGQVEVGDAVRSCTAPPAGRRSPPRARGRRCRSTGPAARRGPQRGLAAVDGPPPTRPEPAACRSGAASCSPEGGARARGRRREPAEQRARPERLDSGAAAPAVPEQHPRAAGRLRGAARRPRASPGSTARGESASPRPGAGPGARPGPAGPATSSATQPAIRGHGGAERPPAQRPHRVGGEFLKREPSPRRAAPSSGSQPRRSTAARPTACRCGAGGARTAARARPTAASPRTSRRWRPGQLDRRRVAARCRPPGRAPRALPAAGRRRPSAGRGRSRRRPAQRRVADPQRTPSRAPNAAWAATPGAPGPRAARAGSARARPGGQGDGRAAAAEVGHRAVHRHARRAARRRPQTASATPVRERQAPRLRLVPAPPASPPFACRASPATARRRGLGAVPPPVAEPSSSAPSGSSSRG